MISCCQLQNLHSLSYRTIVVVQLTTPSICTVVIAHAGKISGGIQSAMLDSGTTVLKLHKENKCVY